MIAISLWLIIYQWFCSVWFSCYCNMCLWINLKDSANFSNIPVFSKCRKSRKWQQTFWFFYVPYFNNACCTARDKPLLIVMKTDSFHRTFMSIKALKAQKDNKISYWKKDCVIHYVSYTVSHIAQIHTHAFNCPFSGTTCYPGELVPER